jgi:hypothetical protein
VAGDSPNRAPVWDTAIVRIWGSSGRVGVIVGAIALLAACSSSRQAGPIGPRTNPTTTSSVPATTSDGTQPGSTSSTAPPGSGTTGSTASSSTVAATTSPSGTRTITIVAVAGSTGAVLPGGPPFSDADPFTEAVRLADGTCTGWDGSAGGTTEGLEVGAPVLILDAENNEEIGRGTIERSRWEDVADGGEQWNCFFELSASVTGSPAEFRIRVGGLQPWLAGPDPADPDTFFASVSTDAAIGLIPACPPVPPEPDETAATTASTAPTTTTTTTTAPAGPAGEWQAIGRYWSQGLRSMCRAGLAVTALARPCRPPGVGSEYISEIVDSNDPTVTYEDNARLPRGTQVTAVVATGRPCE